MDIVQIDPRTIEDHPRNEHYYGPVVPSADFIQSIVDLGIQQNLVVSINSMGEYVCISGHRRKHAAILAELATVPCRVEEYDSDADAELALIALNDQREKTERTLIREVEGYSVALEEAAKGRMASGGSTTTETLSGNPGQGRTVDHLAVHFGMPRDRIESLRTIWSDRYRGDIVRTLEMKSTPSDRIQKMLVEWDDVRSLRESGELSLYAAAQQIHALKKAIEPKAKGKKEAKPVKPKKVEVVFRKKRDGETLSVRHHIQLAAAGREFDVDFGTITHGADVCFGVFVGNDEKSLRVLPIELKTLLDLGV